MTTGSAGTDNLGKVHGILAALGPRGLCDTWIAKLAGISPDQTVNRLCREQDGKTVTRSLGKETCPRCEAERILTRLLASAPPSPTARGCSSPTPHISRANERQAAETSSARFVLICGRREFEFEQAELTFTARAIHEVYVGKRDTVGIVLANEKYAAIRSEVARRYPGWLEQPVGDFVRSLIQASDPLHKRILNAHGNRVYCAYHIQSRHLQQSGLYCYVAGDERV